MRIIPTIYDPVYPPPGTTKVGDGLAWTPRELQVIRERYLSEGMAACVALLPTRSTGAIRNQAAAMGLKRHRPHAKPVPSNDIIDASLRRLYANPMGRGELKAWCAQHHRTRQWAYTRARELGLQLHLRTGDKWRAWSDEEIAFLEDHATLRPESIAKAMKRAGMVPRTPGAIADRMWKAGIDRTDPDVFSGADLERLFGLATSSHTVARWVEKEGLKATRTHDGRQTRYRIHRHDLRDWMIRSTVWDHRRVNREFLIETLAGRVGLSIGEAVSR